MNYERLVEQALAYIEQHLEENLSVEQIAARVHVSPFHFHRVFTAHMGVPLMRFVRERRLARAAMDLRSTGRPLRQIAYDAGFESQAGFTRAFQDRIGISPGRYRQLYGAVPGQRAAVLARYGKEPPVTLIKSCPAMDLVGLGLDDLQIEHDNSPAIVALWQRFFEEVIGTDAPVPAYGVCVPGAGSTFSYVAAVQRQHLQRALPEARVVHLDLHDYAVFPHDEAAGSIHGAFQHIWASGMAATGRHYDERVPDLEVYPPHAYRRRVRMEIWIPVL
jgi:AraC family transcriptional regulator